MKLKCILWSENIRTTDQFVPTTVKICPRPLPRHSVYTSEILETLFSRKFTTIDYNNDVTMTLKKSRRHEEIVDEPLKLAFEDLLADFFV